MTALQATYMQGLLDLKDDLATCDRSEQLDALYLSISLDNRLHKKCRDRCSFYYGKAQNREWHTLMPLSNELEPRAPAAEPMHVGTIDYSMQDGAVDSLATGNLSWVPVLAQSDLS